MFGYLRHKIKDWRFEKRMAKQRAKRGFSDNDCWGMHYWFCDTFPKMIRRLRDMKHGYPELPFEEIENFPLQWVAEASKEINDNKIKSGYEEGVILDDTFDRWQLILTRIAWCLEQADEEKTEIENEYEKEYNRQVWGDDSDIERNWSFKKWWAKHHVVEKYDEKGKPKLYRVITGTPDPEIKEKYWNRYEEIIKYREKCKDEAFDLLKKYFYNLWD